MAKLKRESIFGMLAHAVAALAGCTIALAASAPLSTSAIASAGLTGSLSFASASLTGQSTMNKAQAAPGYDLAVWRSDETELVCIDIVGAKGSFAGWIGAGHGESMASATEMTMAWRSNGSWVISPRKAADDALPPYAGSQTGYKVLQKLSSGARVVFTRPASPSSSVIFARVDKINSVVTGLDSPNPGAALGIALHTSMGTAELDFAPFVAAAATVVSASASLAPVPISSRQRLQHASTARAVHRYRSSQHASSTASAVTSAQTAIADAPKSFVAAAAQSASPVFLPGAGSLSAHVGVMIALPAAAVLMLSFFA